MLMCQDCKSTNIIEFSTYQVYFREGEWVRLRSVLVHQNMNENQPEGFMAFCPELSKTATANGSSELHAILKLGQILKDMCHIEMIGKKIEELDA
jgi:hypothetical protein